MLRGLRMIVATGLALAPLRALAADAVETFYKGRQVILRTGSLPGDGYDLYGRLVSRFISKYIPGNPVIITQYVPSGGSLVLANQFGNTTPRDGSVFGLFNSGMATTPVLNPSAAQFDSRKFNFLGSPVREGHVYVALASAPVTKFDELFTREVIVGATAPGAAPFEFPQVTNAIIGTKMKVIPGYGGSGPIVLAMERGELHGYAGLAWGSAKQAYRAQIAEKKMLVVGQYGMRKHPEMPDVPLFPLGATDADRQLFELLYARQAFGRPFAFPPDVPQDRVAALRKAFVDVTRDPEFLAEAEKLQADIGLVSGEELQELTAKLFQTPTEVVTRIRTLLGTGEAEKAK